LTDQVVLLRGGQSIVILLPDVVVTKYKPMKAGRIYSDVSLGQNACGLVEVLKQFRPTRLRFNYLTTTIQHLVLPSTILTPEAYYQIVT